MKNKNYLPVINEHRRYIFVGVVYKFPKVFSITRLIGLFNNRELSLKLYCLYLQRIGLEVKVAISAKRLKRARIGRAAKAKLFWI